MSQVEQIFECTRCGHCCHGQTTVSLTPADQKRMVQALKKEPEQVKAHYWRVRGNVVQMQVRDGHCIFYHDGCTIHKGRPWRCRQWPLHPSILTDENNFHAIAASCPGLRIEMGYDKFCIILKNLLENEQIPLGEK